MPCRSDYMDPTPTEHKQTDKVNKDAKALADAVTYSCDVLREFLLQGSHSEVFKHVNRDYVNQMVNLQKRAEGLYYMVPADKGLLAHCDNLVEDYLDLNTLVVEGKPLTNGQSMALNKAQVKHRKADLLRLAKVLGAMGDFDRLRKVIDADPTKPLDSQLGFSPDDF